ncbi:hypothetical protein HGRIS_007734 [Hohenbuehelia grisea]|uniref:Uncharacterized protein n=1 Tax=Hohenbuehelia grisea TaxID=104357 RepID=A0ABR3J5T5_9AGAR
MDDDPELAKEMLRLLGQELKLLRAQLRDKDPSGSNHDDSEEILRVKEENVLLRTRLADLEDKSSTITDDSETKPESLRLEVAINEANEALAASLLEKNELRRANDDLKAEHSAIEERYQELLQTETQLREASTELLSEIDRTKMNEERLIISAEKAVKAEAQLREASTGLLDEIEQMKSTQEQLRVSALRSEAKAVKAEAALLEHTFSASRWLKEPRPTLVQPDQFLQSRMQSCIRGKMKKQNIEQRILSYSECGVLWLELPSLYSAPSDRIALIQPSHLYDPNLNGGVGKWSRTDVNYLDGQKWEVFYKSQDCWLYLGIYKTKNYTYLSHHEYATLIKPTNLHKETILNPALTVPLVKNMVPTMYETELLRASAACLELVGINRSIDEYLIQRDRSASHSHVQKRKHIPDVLSDSRGDKASKLAKR